MIRKTQDCDNPPGLNPQTSNPPCLVERASEDRSWTPIVHDLELTRLAARACDVAPHQRKLRSCALKNRSACNGQAPQNGCSPPSAHRGRRVAWVDAGLLAASARLLQTGRASRPAASKHASIAFSPRDVNPSGRMEWIWSSPAPGSYSMILLCWSFVNSMGPVQDCPGGDVLAPGRSIQELFRRGWEGVREDLTDGGTLVCSRFRELAPLHLVPQPGTICRLSRRNPPASGVADPFGSWSSKCFPD
jgi:hypothetical protein